MIRELPLKVNPNRMFRFFRKYRQELISNDQFRKYLKYAIGEILLVVIGILIALQINNWNNNRIESDKIRSYAKLLIEDLERDIQMVEFSRRQATRAIIRLDSLTLYVKDRKIEDISNLDFLCLSSALGYRPFSWSRATLEGMKNSGSLQYIDNDSLKIKIAQYDAFTYHLDQDYISDNSNVTHCKRLISEIINVNYKNLNQLVDALGTTTRRSDWEEDFMVYVRSEGFDFFSREEYDRAKAEGLTMLTKDINEVNKVINNLISLKRTLRMRSDFELPKLISDAEELISLLKESYLDE